MLQKPFSGSIRAWISLLSFVAMPLIQINAAAEDWTSFRNGGGSTSRSSLPFTWSPERGIAWQRELDGYGQSAPVIHDGRVFVTSVVGPMCEQLVVQCFDVTSGEPIWRYEQPTTLRHPSNYMNSRAAPTPLADQHGVYAFFETGDFVCVDQEGKLRWHRNEAEEFETFENNHGIGSSPAMDDEALYLLIEHDGPSSLVKIDKLTGDTIWRTARPSTKSWASPIVVNIEGDRQVVVSSGGTVTGYSASTGDAVWQLDGIEGNSVPSPVAANHLLLVGARLPEFASDGQVRSNCCLDLSQITDGKPKVMWRAEKAICEYASPVASDGFAYFVNKVNVLHCIELDTGEIAYRQRLSLDCWATPIVSGDAVYFFGKNGETRIIRSGPKFAEIATNTLWDPSDPPAPLEYVEASGRSVHGHGHGGSSGHERGHNGQREPGSGMVGRMMAGDANRDGILEGDEVPEPFRPMLPRIDLNGDGRLDSEELLAMAKSFAERRKDAAASARDPIVYGVAAADGRIVVRTGTRLYVIDGQS